MATLTKKDIVERVADKTKMKQFQVKAVVEEAFSVIADALVNRDRIEVRDFGVFKTKSRKARKGRNPHTGESVPVPSKHVVVFKAGMELKKKVA